VYQKKKHINKVADYNVCLERNEQGVMCVDLGYSRWKSLYVGKVSQRKGHWT
jgi:hypothetical protein